MSESNSAPTQDPSALLERERLVSLINSMADGVIATDENGIVAVYNGAALNVLDINTSMTGKQITEIFHPLDSKNSKVDILSLLKETKIPTSRRDLKIIYRDKSIIKLYLSMAPVKLGFGQQGNRGYVLLLRDITREKSLEEERDEFISVVSHELRTPVAVTEGNISNAMLLAERTGDRSQVMMALQQAHQQINFLGNLINDLATLSRAERGKLTVEIEPINVYELIRDLVDSYQPGAAIKGLKITTNVDPALEVLRSSRLYVTEILQNFITNAVKYTKQGSVTITVKPKDRGVEFTVTDTGIGISKQDQDRIFQKFFRSEDYRTRESTGTGLGLYVTLKLARLIHADIDVESELNKGSTFSIYIPNLE